jgi:hypothetical protein
VSAEISAFVDEVVREDPSKVRARYEVSERALKGMET